MCVSMLCISMVFGIRLSVCVCYSIAGEFMNDFGKESSDKNSILRFGVKVVFY